MITETYDENLFISRFEDYKRVVTDENKNGNFSYKGLRFLFNYLEDLSEDTGKNINLDVVALCCDYVEYKNLDEYLNDFSNEHENFLNEKEIEFKCLLNDDNKFNYGKNEFNEWLNDYCKNEMEEEISNKTTLIKFDEDLNEGFIIGAY